MEQTQIAVKVPENIIEGILVTALEGGSNYWLRVDKVSEWKNTQPQRKEPNYLPSYITTPLSKTGVLAVIDLEDKDKKLQLTREKIVSGLKVMAEKEPQHFGDMMKEDGDSTTGDVFLQCALFSEVKYG